MMIHVVLPSPESLPDELRNSPRWLVWRAEQRGSKVAKIPCDRSGKTASMNEHLSDLSLALRDARTLRSAPSGECFGVGYCFGENCNLVCLDLDDAIGSDHLTWFVEQFPTWSEVSLSGRGVHLFFVGTFPGKRSIVIEDAKVEIFGERGFIAVTGDRIPGTAAGLADFGPVSDVLSEYLVKRHLPPVSKPTQNNGTPSRYHAFGQAVLRADCDKILQSIDGQKHYTLRDAAYHAGKFIPLCYSFHDAEAALRDAIGTRGCEDMKAAWKTIESGLRKGMAEPDTIPDFIEGVDVDLSGWGQAQTEANERIIAEKTENAFPSSLLNVPGFIGELMAFTASRSFIVQPVLALAGALSLLATLTGRKVRDEAGTRTNLYTIGVAKTGHGKDMARKINKEILHLAGADGLIGPEGIASSAGLVSAVQQKLCCLFQLDEIGRLLKTTSSHHAPGHLYHIVTELLKFYTSSDSVYLGNAYGDVDKNKTIDQPCVVVYGTTVPEPLYGAFTPETISSGWLGRCLIFESPEQRPAKAQPTVCDPPQSITDFAAAWHNFRPGGNLSMESPRPICLKVEAAATTKLLEFDFYADEQMEKSGPVLGCLWSRATEKARKLAMLYACSCGVGDSATIDAAASQWACELTDYLTRRTVYLAHWNVSENGTESTCLRIEQIIAESGKRGITMSTIYDRTRWATKRERTDAIEVLLMSGRVKQVKQQTAGRPITRLFSADS